MQLRIGDRVVDVEMKDGLPQIQGVWAEEIKRPDGSQDVIVHVPCMRVGSEVKGI